MEKKNLDEKTRKPQAKAKVVSDISFIPNYLIDMVWEKAIPHLLKGEEHWNGFYTLEQIKELCIYGHMQMWTEMKGKEIVGVVLTQLDRYPERLVFRFLYLGGRDFDPEMLEQFPQFELFAMKNGASSVDMLARDGWKKYLPKYGYQPIGTVFRKELIDRNNISKELN